MVIGLSLFSSTVQAPTMGFTPQMAIIQGNSLQARSSLVIPKTYVLASLGTINEPILWQVIDCESGFNQKARGKAGEIGILQFLPTTFKWMSELSGLNGNIYNPEDQIKLADWAFQNGYKNHWSCIKKLGL